MRPPAPKMKTFLNYSACRTLGFDWIWLGMSDLPLFSR